MAFTPSINYVNIRILYADDCDVVLRIQIGTILHSLLILDCIRFNKMWKYLSQQRRERFLHVGHSQFRKWSIWFLSIQLPMLWKRLMLYGCLQTSNRVACETLER